MEKFIFLAALFLISTESNLSIANDCISIQHENNPHWMTVYIQSSGSYCLNFDLVQQQVFDIHSMNYRRPSEALLEISDSKPSSHKLSNKAIFSDNPMEENIFDIDMKNHILKSDIEDSTGLRSLGGIRHVFVRNGSIIVPGAKEATAVSLENGDGEIRVTSLPSYANIRRVGYPDYEDLPASETLDKKAPTYQATNNLVDKMAIKAGWRGVIMGGAGNIIRNSTIDVDGHTAIYMYGPGSIIENNTIIIHGQGEAKAYDAAIKLRDADGAVVRNNKIIYKGFWFGKAPAAINLLDSSDVNISENIVENFKQLVRSNGESHFTESGNVIK
ncbi:right-handed parallel beta-helix repeat-containing protein [Undibacterium sp. Ji67W]|uniref:right-handed parallel beta-helix repeat-containing protein n=1 Tax=Undibacterium sp. Ji67W TaxID=3413042 RepID=UPI003BEF8064